MAPVDDERRRRERRRAIERSRRGHPVGRELPGAVPPPMVARLTEVVDQGEPLALLLESSAALTELGEPGAELDVRWLVGALIDREDGATSACLAVLALLLDDEVMRARIRRELRLRLDEPPAWVGELVARTEGEVRPGHRAVVGLWAGACTEPLARVQVRLDEAGAVVEGAVVPSGPLTSWPDCAALARWAVRVSRVARDPLST